MTTETYLLISTAFGLGGLAFYIAYKWLTKEPKEKNTIWNVSEGDYFVGVIVSDFTCHDNGSFDITSTPYQGIVEGTTKVSLKIDGKWYRLFESNIVPPTIIIHDIIKKQ